MRTLQRTSHHPAVPGTWRQALRLLTMTATVAALATACTTDNTDAPPPPGTGAGPAATGTPAPAGTDTSTSTSPGNGNGNGNQANDGEAGAREVAGRFAEAANAGNEDAVAALFAPDARFDSVGRIYPNRDDIMRRFLVPEVLRVGGRYQPGEQRWDGERLTVTYEFSTGSGGRERFTYAYLVRGGQIRDVIGRYI